MSEWLCFNSTFTIFISNIISRCYRCNWTWCVWCYSSIIVICTICYIIYIKCWNCIWGAIIIGKCCCSLYNRKWNINRSSESSSIRSNYILIWYTWSYTNGIYTSITCYRYGNRKVLFSWSCCKSRWICNNNVYESIYWWWRWWCSWLYWCWSCSFYFS